MTCLFPSHSEQKERAVEVGDVAKKTQLQQQFRDRVLASVRPLITDAELASGMDITSVLAGFARTYLDRQRDLVLEARPQAGRDLQPKLNFINQVCAERCCRSSTLQPLTLAA